MPSGKPPAIGMTITFRYQELTDRGVPRFPSFVRGAQQSQLPPAAGPTACPAPGKPTPLAHDTQVCRRRHLFQNGDRASQPYFEFHDDKSSKFWEISKADTEVTVRFGKLGANGQTQAKTFGDTAAAKKHQTS